MTTYFCFWRTERESLVWWTTGEPWNACILCTGQAQCFPAVFAVFFLHYFLTLFHVFCEGFLLWSVELKLNLLCTHFWVFYRLICRLLIQVSWTAVSFLVDLALFCTLIFGWLFISFVSGLHTVLNESLDYSFGWLQGALLSTSSGNLRWRVQLPLCGLLVPSLVHL